MFTRFVDWLIRHAKKTPYFHLNGYMERYWVVKPSKYIPFASRIHHILRSDTDRHLHDHPWYYMTIILRGGYYEVTYATYEDTLKYFYDRRYKIFYGDDGIRYKQRWYGAGSVIMRKPGSWHRLVVPEGQTAWTWFFTSRKKQDWGFMTDSGKVLWRNYFKDYKEGDAGVPREEYAHP